MKGGRRRRPSFYFRDRGLSRVGFQVSRIRVASQRRRQLRQTLKSRRLSKGAGRKGISGKRNSMDYCTKV